MSFVKRFGATRASRTDRLRRHALRALLLLAACAPAAPGGASAQGAAPAAPDPWWLPRYDFALEVDGQPSADAHFFTERDGRRLLVEVPQLPKAALLSPATKEVKVVDRSDVVIEGDGESARLAPGADAGSPTGSFTLQGDQVVFYLGSNRLKITPKPALEGPAKVDAILRHSPMYRRGVDEYTPDPSEISFLRSFKSQVEIEVYFGTWCPHCKVMVPKFIKTMKSAANPNIVVSYVGVPKNFGDYAPAKAKDVKGIPTFIFYKDGKEIGRIPGEPTNGSIEHAVAEMLRSGK
jgi:thiol-disulfide isomerase/thioredoxin